MPSLGEILCHENFTFTDGTTGKKLVIVLNVPAARDPCIVIKTTSQSKRYQGVKPGCDSSRRMFFLPAGVDVFRQDTYVQLDETFELSCAEMAIAVLKKELSSIGTLSQLTISQVKNCLKKLRLDIPQRHYDHIFK